MVSVYLQGSSGLLFQLRKSYSLNDLMNTEVMDRVNEIKLQSKNEYNRINVASKFIPYHIVYEWNCLWIDLILFLLY